MSGQISLDKALEKSKVAIPSGVVGQYSPVQDVTVNPVSDFEGDVIEPIPLKPKATETAVVKKSRSKCENAFLRDVPREVIAFAKSKFPTAMNQTDAVCAYIYVRSGKSVDVPEHVKELAETWSEDKSFETMDKRLYNIEQTQKKIYELVDDMVLITSYLMFDRMGFRRGQPMSPEKVDMLEPGIEELMDGIKIQAKKLRQKKAIKEGRPKTQVKDE